MSDKIVRIGSLDRILDKGNQIIQSKPPYATCDQKRRSACTFVQSDQHLICCPDSIIPIVVDSKPLTSLCSWAGTWLHHSECRLSRGKDYTNSWILKFTDCCPCIKLYGNLFQRNVAHCFKISRCMTKQTKLPLHPVKPQISLGIRLVWSVFVVRFMGSYGPKVSSCGQWRLWPVWADAQADLSLG